MIKYYCDICGKEINDFKIKIKKDLPDNKFFTLTIPCIGEIKINTDEPLTKTLSSPGIICKDCIKQFIE